MNNKIDLVKLFELYLSSKENKCSTINLIGGTSYKIIVDSNSELSLIATNCVFYLHLIDKNKSIDIENHIDRLTAHRLMFLHSFNVDNNNKINKIINKIDLVKSFELALLLDTVKLRKVHISTDKIYYELNLGTITIALIYSPPEYNLSSGGLQQIISKEIAKKLVLLFTDKYEQPTKSVLISALGESILITE